MDNGHPNGNVTGNGSETQQALRDSELSYRRLFEAAKDGILILDVATGRVTDANPFLCKLLGYSHSEMVGQTVGELSPFKDIVANQAMLELLQKHGYVRYEDLPLETKDGRKIAVEFVSNVYQAGDKKVIQCNIRDNTEHQRKKEVLHESEQLIEGILNAMPVRVFWKDLNLNYLGCNALFARDAGFADPKDIIGKDDSQMGWRDQVELYRSDDRQVIESGCSKLLIEEPQTTPEGNTITLLSSKVPLRNSEGEICGMLGTYLDITKRKLAEAEQAHLAAIVQSSEDPIVGMTPQGIVTSWNASAEKVFGYPANEMVGQPILRVIPFDRQHEEEEILGKIQRGENVQHYETVRLRKDGSSLEVSLTVSAIKDSAGRITGASKVMRDITERKKTEEQIAEQAALLDKTQDAIMVSDLEGKVLFWNKGAELMYGWTREEALGRVVRDLIYKEQGKGAENARLVLEKGDFSNEFEAITKDRRTLTVAARRSLIRDDEGRPKAIIAITTDITEKKKLESQYMRAQRMESIGTLAGGIAHDLNNILAPIMMSIDILKSTSDSPETQQILETIGISAKRGADIVRQVLTFARGVEGEKIEVQPKHLLRDLENIIKDTFPKNIRLRFSIPRDTWTILGDPTQVHQVLLNLCVNARDAMPHGGDLTVGVENCVLDEQYAAMNIEAEPGRYVKISVTDSGTGIPPGILERIFDPFFTTKELGKGTGLGLSTVMTIVKSHEGFINVYSEPGKGTTFRVYLPAMESSSEARTRQTQSLSPPRGHGETILVVDDEASILTITSETLQTFGYRVLTATDGAEAVAIYSEHKNEIAVVLTDMMMPVMDGTAAIHALMKINPAIRIIAASGLDANDGKANASEAGVKHFLMKPYTAATLLKTMRATLDEK